MTDTNQIQQASLFSVLYIEDNEANLRLVQQVLARLGNVELHCTREPRQGIAMAMELIPNLILLDINLPIMNGFDVLERLRSESATQHIPVYAITANAMKSDMDKAKQAGFDDYITKPFVVVDFLQKIEAAKNH